MDCITLGQIAGEPFLGIDAGESLATAVAKLRDHDCAAVVYRIQEEWSIIPAELLPWLLMTRPETLEKPVSALGQPLTTLSELDSPAFVQGVLQSQAWVGVVREGRLVRLLQWASLGLSRLGRSLPASSGSRAQIADSVGRGPLERRKARLSPPTYSRVPQRMV